MFTKYDIERFLVLEKYGFASKDIFELMRLNIRIHRMNEINANTGFTESQEKTDRNQKNEVHEIMQKYPQYGYEINGDPRYYTICIFRDKEDTVGYRL